ncbi:MAG: serine hydrolase [Bacteroidales bacterium]|nr:MAG: serine hydrolase [Bacteroidales bacterium]
MRSKKGRVIMKRILVRFFTLLFSIALFSLFIRFTTARNSFYNEFKLRKEKTDPAFLASPKEWVDSVFNSLSQAERIGQLIMVAVHHNNNEYQKKEIKKLIQRYNIGGLIFFQGSPHKQAKLTNYYQSLAKTPLLIALDAEYGLAMRLDSTVKYPMQMMLGAVNNEKLIYDMGVHIAKQLKQIGTHINFAPVIDVNNNPNNPVINMRSFGEDRVNVARKGLLYMKGMQDNHVLAVAKHFPGHGDTDTDSHLTLPLIPHSKERLDSIELFPFKELINSGLDGIMTAHLSVPAIDTTDRIASSLSPDIVTGLLKEDLGFKGLIFTDAMNMGGVNKHFSPVTANIKAISAGNDILLMPHDIPKTISMIQREIRRGKISREDIDDRCRKILAAKYWVGLNNYKPVNLRNLNKNLNIPEFTLLQRKLIESSLTLVINKNELIPLKRLDTLKIVSIALGSEKSNIFQNTLELYCKTDKISIDKKPSLSQCKDLLDNYNLFVVSIHNTDIRVSKDYGISYETVSFVDSLSEKYNVILSLHANPYALARFKNLKKLSGLIISYQDTEIIQSLSAQLIFGAIPAEGSLPVSVNGDLPVRSSIKTRGNLRLKYTIPCEVEIDQGHLLKIDSIAASAIMKKVTPGCQVLVAKEGKVIYHKSFGYHTYRKKHKVKHSDLYDLASITKIAGTVPVVMKMYEQDLINLDTTLSTYLLYLDTTDKSDIIIKDVLLHQSRLKSWIPFYISTLEPVYPEQSFASNKFSFSYPIQIGPNYFANKHLRYKEGYFAREYSGEFPIQVAEKLFMNESFIDSIYNTIANSELNGEEGYKYSDLGFYLLYRIMDENIKQGFRNYLDSEFYRPLGANSMGFCPLERFSRKQITPTENDLVFRKQLVHGYVHDPGASMLGGVCGHAGLFSNANDLAKLMQMYLNGGSYGDKRYVKEKTVDYFTSCQDRKNGNRRGIGFDKPETDTTKSGPTYEGVSAISYGHTGFTGTMAWADPEHEIIYIFLSNRVYPDAVNNKIVEYNIRTEIQKVIYDAMK